MRMPYRQPHLCDTKFFYHTTNLQAMKTKLILLLSIFSAKNSFSAKGNRIKQSLLTVAEEVAAWVLLGGFVLGIFWVAGILFAGQMG
jgi:hypothetical protein